jgi:hypothetical protein
MKYQLLLHNQENKNVNNKKISVTFSDLWSHHCEGSQKNSHERVSLILFWPAMYNWNLWVGVYILDNSEKLCSWVKLITSDSPHSCIDAMLISEVLLISCLWQPPMISDTTSEDRLCTFLCNLMKEEINHASCSMKETKFPTRCSTRETNCSTRWSTSVSSKQWNLGMLFVVGFPFVAMDKNFIEGKRFCRCDKKCWTWNFNTWF